MLPSSISSAGRGRQPKSGQRQLIALSTEQGFPFWLAWGTILRGWALAEQGQGEEGIAQMRQGLAAYRATGAELARPYCLALLAEAYGKVGQAEEGLSVLAEALAAGGQNWGALLRGGAVSAERGADAATVQSPKSKVQQSANAPSKRKPKRVFSKPSRLPAASRRSRWNCER